jgi:hypothetical protein
MPRTHSILFILYPTFSEFLAAFYTAITISQKENPLPLQKRERGFDERNAGEILIRL